MEHPDVNSDNSDSAPNAPDAEGEKTQEAFLLKPHVRWKEEHMETVNTTPTITEDRRKVLKKTDWNKSSANIFSSDIIQEEVKPATRRSLLKRTETLSRLVKTVSSKNLSSDFNSSSSARRFQIHDRDELLRKSAPASLLQQEDIENDIEPKFQNWVNPLLSASEDITNNVEEPLLGEAPRRKSSFLSKPEDRPNVSEVSTEHTTVNPCLNFFGKCILSESLLVSNNKRFV